MLSKDTLEDIKSKLPFRYSRTVSDAYLKLHGKTISRWTIRDFLRGKSYSQEMHKAILRVVENQQLLNQKTTEVLDNV